MTEQDYSDLAKRISLNVRGKTVTHADYPEELHGYALRLHFSDGSRLFVPPDHEDGLIFTQPVCEPSG